jgi:segregation and condensation protein B
MAEKEVQEEAQDEASAEGQEGSEDAPESKLIVEGLLFSAGKPLRIADIEEATTLARKEVRTTLRKLASDYRRRNTAIEIVKVGSRWTMQLKTDFTPHARAIVAAEVPGRLLRTLALIAYHQPVLQSDLQEMLGPKVYDHVRELASIGLVNATRKGSTKQLTTTQKFPEYFGIASAKKEDIKRFLADRVGISPPEPAADDVPESPTEPEGEGMAPEPEDDQR